MTNSECQPILQKLEAWAFTSSSIHGDANSQSHCFFEAPNHGIFSPKMCLLLASRSTPSKSGTSTHLGPSIGLFENGGCDGAKTELVEVVDFLKNTSRCVAKLRRET